MSRVTRHWMDPFALTQGFPDPCNARHLGRVMVHDDVSLTIFCKIYSRSDPREYRDVSKRVHGMDLANTAGSLFVCAPGGAGEPGTWLSGL